MVYPFFNFFFKRVVILHTVFVKWICLSFVVERGRNGEGKKEYNIRMECWDKMINARSPLS